MPVVEIISRSCRDCYRCLRRCPVHAIRVREGHAWIVAERCITCGQCVRECPRHAIRVASAVDVVKALIATGDPVIASVSLMDSSRVSPIVAEIMPALLALGFAGTEATTCALRVVWTRYRQLAAERETFVIASGCPSVVALVEQYYPEALPLLAPVVSHAEAHARLIKARARARGFPQVRVVSIEPEPAVKGELARRPTGDGSLDAALTLGEVRRWIRRELGTRMPSVPEAEIHLPDQGPPLEWVRDILPIYGLEECIDFLLRIPRRLPRGTVVEMAVCRYGCAIGSPRLLARVPEAGAYLYPKGSPLAPGEETASVDIATQFADRHVELPQPTEEQLREILQRLGMHEPDDELNCGACGYHTCREKAVAVFQGMAEIEMCMPYMRRRAQQVSAIIEHTANGILLVDQDFRIVFVNPSFERMFHCSAAAARGRKATEILGSDCFERAAAADGTLAERGESPAKDLVYRIQIFPIKGEPLLAAVIVDITADDRARREHERVKQATLERAQEVISRQMQTAQEIASLLGETTAETKALLVRLMDVVRKEAAQ